jgi:hypothetical protein
MRVHDAKISQDAYIAGIGFQDLAKTGLGSIVVAGLESRRCIVEDFLVGGGLGGEKGRNEDENEGRGESRTLL